MESSLTYLSEMISFVSVDLTKVLIGYVDGLSSDPANG